MGLAALVLTVLLFVLFSVGGCSVAPFHASSAARPADCADSVIWDLTGNPTLAGTPLVLAVYEAAKHKPEYRPAILEAVDYTQGLFENTDLTYSDFALAVTQRIEWLNRYMGVELLIAADLIGLFDQRLPISPCDRRLICQHLAKQRRFLSTLN
jgi:hypothetical protein